MQYFSVFLILQIVIFYNSQSQDEIDFNALFWFDVSICIILNQKVTTFCASSMTFLLLLDLIPSPLTTQRPILIIKSISHDKITNILVHNTKHNITSGSKFTAAATLHFLSFRIYKVYSNLQRIFQVTVFILLLEIHKN